MVTGIELSRSGHSRRAGEQLRTARRGRNLPLDEIANEIRIPPKYLRALEEGDLSVFSADVYARGAYQKYARFLGLESRDIYHSFLRSLSEVRQRVSLKLPVPATWLQRALTPYGVIGFSVGLVGLVIVSYLGWQVRSFIQLPDLELLEPVNMVVEGDTVIIRGRAEADALITVNGETVLPGEDQEFLFELPVRPGINVLQVEATGASGRTRVVTRDLLVTGEGN